jgi:hypothetical protein
MNLKITNRLIFLVALSGSGILISCEKKEDPKHDDEAANYVLGFRAQTGPTSDGDADYLLTAENLMSGSISATGRGVEQLGWCYYGKAGNTIFSLNYDLNECIGYRLIDGKITEISKFIFERMDCMNPGGDDNTLVAIGAPWGGGSFDCQIQLVDGESISVYKNVKTPIYVSFDSAGSQLNAWPTHSYVQGDKMYISFYPLHGVSWETPLTDTAYVSVYSYPELEYQLTFKDGRTGPIGYYGSQPAILEDEDGNHYTISTCSYMAGFTRVTKPSGILRINAGETAFASDYFFNVGETSGLKVLTAVYVGNGKAVARVVDESLATPEDQWAAFSYSETEPCTIAILDLVNKTVTPVSGVPGHRGQYQTPFLVEDGKVYLSVNDGASTFIYEIDPESAKGVKGAEVLGREIQAFFRL